MALSTNIQKRPGSANFYVRLGVPTDLQDKIGKREIWRSLRTTDAVEARRLGALEIAKHQAEMQDIRRRRAPTEADLQGAAWDHYQAGLSLDAAARLTRPTPAAIEAERERLMQAARQGKVPTDPLGQMAAALDYLVMRDVTSRDREARAVREKTLREHLVAGETALVDWRARQVIEAESLLIQPGTAAYADLCQRLIRAELQEIARANERDVGDWSGTPSDPTVKPTDPDTSVKAAEPGRTILALYDQFHREKAGKATADTWQNNRQIIKLFASYVGEHADASTITRATVRGWKEALFKWPVKAADITVFRGLSFKKVIEKNATVGKPTISEKSINKYLSALGGFATWLLANGYISEDIMKGMYLDIDKSEKKRFPYTKDQLTTIFKSPLFTGFETDKREHIPGIVQTRDWRFWLPLMTVFTGARLGELAQLATADVRQIGGVWCFHITEEGEAEKSVKTDGSMRVVPIRSDLIKIGILDYHNSIAEAGKQRLFPELRPDARGFYSAMPSDFLNGYFRRIGVKTDKLQNVHSFRHGFADAMRRAGYLDEQFAPLLGHTKASTTGRYGIVPQGIIEQRLDMIEAADFQGLDLQHLQK
ncbi:DUF6538 domain-containing protein [Xanthobacter autotrophicus]|uniref:DUF6538 domain-containing protein n=1 Tax=Xanthobacter autotrophicus TaxID=280 RepID=UPI003729A171